MRLEVLVDSEEPKIFPLSKAKIVIGSSESCDIILPNKDISRKHLVLAVEGDKYFVVDQGSSNGSYLNEERLVPGRKVEFTSFFPVRLGSGVLITLLSDEEAEASGSELIEFAVKNEKAANSQSGQSDTKTTMMSLKDLQAPKTETLIKQRKEYLGQKKSGVKKIEKKNTTNKSSKEETQSIFIKVFAVAVVMAGVLYQFVLRPEDRPVEEVKTETVINQPVVVKEAPKRSELLVDEADIVPKENLIGMLPAMKCTTPAELQLCEQIPGAKGGQWGAVQVGTMMNVLLDGNQYFEESNRYVPTRYLRLTHTPEGKKANAELIQQFIAAYFIAKGIPSTLDLTLYEGMNLTFSLFLTDSEKPELTIVLKTEALKKLKEAFTIQHIENARDKGSADELSFLKHYYTFY